MRRRYAIALLAALALCGLAWWGARPPATRLRAPVPGVAVGPSDGGVRRGERSEARAQPPATTGDTATMRCDADPLGRTVYAQRVGALETVLPDASGTFALTPGTWRLYADDGTFSVKLGDLVVTGGELVPCTLARADVRGRVRNPAGRPVPRVVIGGGDCPYTRSEDDGTFVLPDPPAGCALTAWFRDGLLRRPSNTVVITPWRTGDVELVLDDTPVAGLGIGIGAVRDGIAVRKVHSGTPAERAGLREGDVIVSVDGADLGESPDLNTFIGLGTGPAGSTVRVEVLRGEEMESFTLVRERLSDP